MVQMLFYIIFAKRNSQTAMRMDDPSKKRLTEEEESTCTLDCFEGELKDFRKFIYSRSVLRLKLYEYVLSQYQTRFRNAQCVALALCLMAMAVEGLDEARQDRRLSEEGRWQEELHRMEQAVRQSAKTGETSKQSTHFLEVLKNKAEINNFSSEYLHFFEIESPLIYKKSRTVWRLLEFHSFFFSQNTQLNNLTQFEIDRQLEKFNLEVTKKENQLRLNAHIQECMQQPIHQAGTEIKAIMKLQTYIQRHSKPFAAQQPAFPLGFTVKQLMLMEINMDTISLVERCEAYECPYMLFCIPFLYLLAETLSYYQAHRELYIYYLFVTLISRINRIKNGLNPQLPREEVDGCIVDFLNFRKLSASQTAVKLGQFLTRHEAKMSTFIPVYFHIFSFHAFEKHDFVEGLFAGEGSVGDRRRKMKERVQLVFDECQKYNNESI